MKDASILLIEDYPSTRDATRIFLSMAGHTVVREAATLSEALGAVDAVANGDIVCDVVILDGNLSNIAGRPNSEDARDVVSRIHEHELGVKVVGFSNREPLSELGIAVDVDFNKGASLHGLVEVIAGL